MRKTLFLYVPTYRIKFRLPTWLRKYKLWSNKFKSHIYRATAENMCEVVHNLP